jgi:hypothetical protein
VIDRPRWMAVVVLAFLVAAGCGIALAQTTVGRQALVDQWEGTALAFGQEVDDERYAAMVALSENASLYAAISAFARGPLLTFALAGLIYAVFGRLRVGGAEPVRYTQVLAVVAHAGVIIALQQLVATPLNYARETMASPTTLGHLFPMFDEASLPARFLGALDLFVVWWLIVVAIGVALLYRRSAPSTATIFIGGYVGFATLLAIAMAVTGGTV